MDEIQITQVELPRDEHANKRAAHKPAKGAAKKDAKVHKLDTARAPAAKPSHAASRKKVG